MTDDYQVRIIAFPDDARVILAWYCGFQGLSQALSIELDNAWRIAKEINKSERYVWKALALLENPTKSLDSEDWTQAPHFCSVSGRTPRRPC
jgi:hypothetical protein